MLALNHKCRKSVLTNSTIDGYGALLLILNFCDALAVDAQVSIEYQSHEHHQQYRHAQLQMQLDAEHAQTPASIDQLIA